MPTRKELDEKAEEVGLDPEDYSNKVEEAEAIEEAVEEGPKDHPDKVFGSSEPLQPISDIEFVDADKAKKGTVLYPLTHAGEITLPGEKVPSDLSDEAVEALREQGHVK